MKRADKYGRETEFNCPAYKGAVSVAAWADEVIQLGGAAMLVAGLLIKTTVPVSTASSSNVQVLPGAGPTPLGITLRYGAF